MSPNACLTHAIFFLEKYHDLYSWVGNSPASFARNSSAGECSGIRGGDILITIIVISVSATNGHYYCRRTFINKALRRIIDNEPDQLKYQLTIRNESSKTQAGCKDIINPYQLMRKSKLPKLCHLVIGHYAYDCTKADNNKKSN